MCVCVFWIHLIKTKFTYNYLSYINYILLKLTTYMDGTRKHIYFNQETYSLRNTWMEPGNISTLQVFNEELISRIYITKAENQGLYITTNYYYRNKQHGKIKMYRDLPW